MLASSASAKTAALVVSALLHAGIAVAAVTGHAPSQGLADAEVAVDVETSPAPTIEQPDVETIKPEVERAVPVALREAPRTLAPTPAPHTHPYPVSIDHAAHAHDPNLEHPHAAPPASPRSDEHADDHDHDHDKPALPPLVGGPITIQTHGDGHPSSSSGSSASSGSSGSGGAAWDGGRAEIVPESRVTTRASAITRVVPEYPPDARAELVEARLVVEIVVDTSGAVLSARALTHAGYGFEASAAAALRRFRFTPALVNGVPVRVRMTWPVEFKLR